MPTLEETLMRRRGQGGITTVGSPWQSSGGTGKPSFADNKVGFLTTGQLRGRHGWGRDFQEAARQGGIETLQKGYSTIDPRDQEALDAVRDAYGRELGELNRRFDMNRSAVDTASQKSLRNLLSQYKTSQAGTGRIGSSQYDVGGQDILGKIAEESTKQMYDLEGRRLQELGAISGGLAGVYNQGLQERSFQNAQAQSLADYLAKQLQMDLNRDAGLAQLAQAEDAAKQQFWGNIIQGAASAAGGMYGAGMLGGKPGQLMDAQIKYYGG